MHDHATTTSLPFHDAELSELNNMCDDSTRLSAREINPLCLRQLIDAYFLHHHNQPYSFFHEEHLRQDISSGVVSDHLITAVCAIAIRFTTDHDPQTRAALAFSRSSWASVSQLDMDADGEFDLEVVQSLTLLAIFEYTGAEYTRRALRPCPDPDVLQKRDNAVRGLSLGSLLV
jgi:hypothetical protein